MISEINKGIKKIKRKKDNKFLKEKIFKILLEMLIRNKVLRKKVENKNDEKMCVFD